MNTMNACISPTWSDGYQHLDIYVLPPCPCFNILLNISNKLQTQGYLTLNTEP